MRRAVVFVPCQLVAALSAMRRPPLCQLRQLLRRVGGPDDDAIAIVRIGARRGQQFTANNAFNDSVA